MAREKTQVLAGGKRIEGEGVRGDPGIFSEARVGSGNHRRVRVIKRTNQERRARAFTIRVKQRKDVERGHDHRRGVVT